MEENSYWTWVKRVALWDGMVPLLVIGAAPALNMIWPNIMAPKQDGLAIFVNVALPIAAFFVRMEIGGSYFETNPHRTWQSGVFFVAISYLVFFDALMIVMRLDNNMGALEFWTGFAIGYLPYLFMMGIAFFPVKELIAHESANLSDCL